MRATSLSRTTEPSGFSRTTICAELLFGDQPALGDDGVGEFLARRDGLPPICPAGLTVFWLLTALMMSRDGDVELGQLVGFDPEAHGILARAENIDLGMPFTRVIWSTG